MRRSASDSVFPPTLQRGAPKYPKTVWANPRSTPLPADLVRPGPMRVSFEGAAYLPQDPPQRAPRADAVLERFRLRPPFCVGFPLITCVPGFSALRLRCRRKYFEWPRYQLEILDFETIFSDSSLFEERNFPTST